MSSKETDKPKILSLNLFPVVGIGASAGGLDAFKKLLKAIPDNSGMAYVLVQHLDPNHESLLPEILQKVTKIPVLEITDDIKVQPDHIYVIPSNKMMVATDGVLLLAPRPTKSKTGHNLPIDLFFTSLAEVHQEHAIGVVLSGTASDGTLGLKAIKENGGITFAQDEASAEYEGMPHSAAQAGVVDFILPPEEIPKKLLEVTHKTILSDEELQNITKQDEDVFRQILSLLRIRKGVDFTYYKQTTVRRRILRRMVVNKNEDPADYLQFLRGNNLEQDLLYQDMLIPVTSFFRDKKVFEDVCNNVFPTILKNKVPGEITRIWVAGCSTGQEVYSFAICIKEFLGDNFERVQIFGTDLSEPAILKARTGIYEKSELDAVSPERLKEYFTKNNGGYQVNKSIRDMCVFAHHNFLKDPPFGKMDCISCRNVLIYMEPYLQKKALTTFHYALNPTGFLLLGKSETTGGVPDLFSSASKTDRLYTPKDVPGRFMQVTSQRSEQILNHPSDSSKSDPDRSGRTDFQKTADDILLTKYTPAGVVVNEAVDIVHFRGNTANYLEQAPGKPSHNLLKMAKNGLSFELRNIVHKAKAEKAPVIKENIPMSVNGQLLHITIEALPLPNTLEPYYLILFHDHNLNNTGVSVITNRKKVSAKTKKDEKDIQIQLLEQELAQTREDMRSITEDQEASNEELQSANEELLSGSEELQSLNEELETSKEELQSTNEELTVLNHELLGLNEQVTDARNYSESIVGTLYQPLLVLDKNLRVKTANQAFYKTFQVIEQETEGVLIYDLGNRQWNIPELRTLLEEILPQKKQISDYEVTHNFLSIGQRIILLNALELTREKKEEKLILLSIEDITERKEAAKKIEESEKRKAFLLKLSDAIRPLSNSVDIEEAITKIALDFMNADWCHYCTIDGDNLIILRDAVRGDLPSVVGEYQISNYPLFNAILDAGRPVIVDDVNSTDIFDEELKQLCVQLQNISFINVPVIKNGKPVGLLSIVQSKPRKWTDSEVQLTIETAERTWAAVERAKAEEALRKSEEKYRSLFTSIDQGFAHCELVRNKEGNGIDFYVLEVNPTYEKQAGISMEMVVGKSMLQVFPALDKWWIETYTTVVDKQCPVVFEHYFEITHRWFAVNAYPGEKDRFAVLFNDITDRKQAEEKLKESESRFRSLADQSPMIVYLVEPDATATMSYFNKSWLDYTGQTFDEAISMAWDGIVHPDDLQEVLDIYIPAFLDRRPYTLPAIRLRRHDGEYRWHLFKGNPRYFNGGEFAGFVGVGFDVHEQKINEERKDEFISLASHEMKTPLTTAKAYLQVLERFLDDSSGNANVYAKKASQSINRLNELISELLDVSKIQLGKLNYSITTFNFNNMVDSTVENMQLISLTHAIIKTGKVGNDVFGDKARLQQVLINLLTNAIKYSPGAEKVFLNVEQENNMIKVSVRDNGIGIAEQSFDKIFDKYYRVEEHSMVFQGLGIGLFISHEIIQRHNGKLWVESETGKGSTFYFTLPVVHNELNNKI